MSVPQVNNSLSISGEAIPSRNFLENIAYKEINGLGLSCFEHLVHCFLTLFSCCYSDYRRIYVTEFARKIENSRDRIEEIRARSSLRAPERLDAASSPLQPHLEPQGERGRLPVVAVRPIIDVPAVRAPWVPSNALRDDTAGKIAELRPSEETNSDGKPYQSLFLKSEQTQQYHKVILCPRESENDRPIQMHFDLSDGDDVWIREGYQKQMLIFIENALGKKSYIINLPPQSIDYRDQNGEKVYITNITNLDFESRFEYSPKNGERLSAVFPNLLPPIVIEPGAKITPFKRKGKLYDFTHKAIAGLEISDEPHAESEKSYEYLTLNGIKVLLYREDEVDFRLHFDLHDVEDAIIIKHASPHVAGPFIKIEAHTSFSKEMYALNLKSLYQRTYTNASGATCKESVLITNVRDASFRDNEALRQTFSLVWPPVR